MSAGRGYPTRFDVVEPKKEIRVTRFRLYLDEGQVEALRSECEAALREWDEERAQELHAIQEDESADSADPMNA